MDELLHCTYRINPRGTRCKGDLGHDERVWGCMGFGMEPACADAPAHCHGVVLETSVWADDVQLEGEGKWLHPELAELAGEPGVPDWKNPASRLAFTLV